MTGDRMADYPTTKGRFLTSVDALQQQGFKISFYDRLDELIADRSRSSHQSGTQARGRARFVQSYS